MDPRLKKNFVNYNPKQETTATRTEEKTFPVGQSVFKKEVVRPVFLVKLHFWVGGGGALC